jgi:hypothetical protein
MVLFIVRDLSRSVVLSYSVSFSQKNKTKNLNMIPKLYF